MLYVSQSLPADTPSVNAGLYLCDILVLQEQFNITTKTVTLNARTTEPNQNMHTLQLSASAAHVLFLIL